MAPDSDDAIILDAERALLDPAIRGERARVEALLAPDFREIGQSARLWHRDEMIDALTADAAAAEPSAALGPVALDEVDVSRLADDLRLLTYRLSLGGASSRRSSVWRLTESGPQLVFHQGTSAP